MGFVVRIQIYTIKKSGEIPYSINLLAKRKKGLHPRQKDTALSH